MVSLLSFLFFLASLGWWTSETHSFSAVTTAARIVRTGPSGRSTTTSLWVTTANTLEAAAVVQEKKDGLEELGIRIPFGLRQTLVTNARQAIQRRFWIVDNSGSMALLDGHQVSVNHGDHTESCTRWCEVQETVLCHSLLSAAVRAPTEFRLLNPPKSNGCCFPGSLVRDQRRFRVGYGEKASKDCKRAQAIMLRNEPNGRTPLSDSIKEVRREIVRMLPQLEAEAEEVEGGGKVCIVIATDGGNYNVNNVGLQINEEDRNKEIVDALQSLQDLPVCVVIRLCTDYAPLVDFYNDLDEHLDNVDIDVLDDHVAEAEEVYQHNPWLNYALILHRMREMGQESRLFDLLDERPLTRAEVREFCVLLFGQKNLLDYDGDHNDWKDFVREIDMLQQREQMQWNPHTKAMSPWIDLQKLASLDQ